MPALNHFDYFTDIEQTFIKRRGKHLMIGPLDWALIDSWQKRGIPLRVVLQAIEEVFDSIEQRAESTVNVRSLKYCNDAVERHFREWSNAHVGASVADEASVNDESDENESGKGVADRHIRLRIKELEEISEHLPKILHESVQKIILQLVNLEDKGHSAAAENALEDMESLLDEVILSNKNLLLTADIENAVRSSLRQYGLSGDAATEAYDRIFCREIRKAYQIPRLSLYEI